MVEERNFEDEAYACMCWQCGGTGMLAGCFEDTCCGADCDPEDPEYSCAPSRCDACGGKGDFLADPSPERKEQS